MMAKKKEIPVITIQKLELNEEELAAQLEIVRIESPPEREAGKVIEDEPAEAAKKLVEFLHQEAKLI